MRDYNPLKNRPYRLEKSVYRLVLAEVRHYDAARQELKELMGASSSVMGYPRGSRPGDPTADKAVRMEKLWDRVRAVDRALLSIPKEYRMAVLNKVRYDVWPVEMPCGKNLPGYWKSRFLYRVAVNLHLIE